MGLLSSSQDDDLWLQMILLEHAFLNTVFNHMACIGFGGGFLPWRQRKQADARKAAKSQCHAPAIFRGLTQKKHWSILGNMQRLPIFQNFWRRANGLYSGVRNFVDGFACGQVQGNKPGWVTVWPHLIFAPYGDWIEPAPMHRTQAVWPGVCLIESNGVPLQGR